VTIAVEQDAGARDGDRQNLRCWVGLVSKRCANDLMPNDTIPEMNDAIAERNQKWKKLLGSFLFPLSPPNRKRSLARAHACTSLSLSVHPYWAGMRPLPSSLSPFHRQVGPCAQLRLLLRHSDANTVSLPAPRLRHHRLVLTPSG
jgi:hypothetical protein